MCARYQVRAVSWSFFDVSIDARKFVEVLDPLCAAGHAFEPEDTLESLCEKVEHVAVLLSLTRLS